METLFAVKYSFLIPLLPLIGACVSGFFGARWLKQNSHWPIWIGVGCSAILSFLLLFGMFARWGTGEELKIAITNSAGQPVANLKAAGAPGLGRVNWDLRPTEDVRTKYGGDDPKKFVPSGEYTAEMSYGKEKMKQTFRVEIAEGIITR